MAEVRVPDESLKIETKPLPIRRGSDLKKPTATASFSAEPGAGWIGPQRKEIRDEEDMG